MGQEQEILHVNELISARNESTGCSERLLATVHCVLSSGGRCLLRVFRRLGQDCGNCLLLTAGLRTAVGLLEGCGLRDQWAGVRSHLSRVPGRGSMREESRSLHALGLATLGVLRGLWRRDPRPGRVGVWGRVWAMAVRHQPWALAASCCPWGHRGLPASHLFSGKGKFYNLKIL